MAFRVGYLKRSAVVQTKISLPFILFLLLGLKPCWNYGKHSPSLSWALSQASEIIVSCGRAETSHPCCDACHLYEQCPVSRGFCRGLGGWVGMMVRTQASLWQSSRGKWSTAWGMSRQLAATQGSSASSLPVPLPSPCKERYERTTEHCNRDGWGLAVCLVLTLTDEMHGSRWLWRRQVLVCGLWFKEENLLGISSSVPNGISWLSCFFEASSYHQLQDGHFGVIRVEPVSTKSRKINKAQFRNKIVHVKFDFWYHISPSMFAFQHIQLETVLHFTMLSLQI